MTNFPQATPEATTVSSDVFVVGGGPAGLACAIACALRGLQVVVADGMRPPIDKACGEGLLPDALKALEALGLDFMGTEWAPIEGISFNCRAQRSGRELSASASFPSASGRGMRRVLLHELLIARALELGVRIEWQTTVQSTQSVQNGSHLIEARQDAGRTSLRFACRYLVGADGHSSRVREWAGLSRARSGRRRVGLRQHYDIAPWNRKVEVHWAGPGQASVTPVSATQVCVAFVANRKFASPSEALEYFPELAARLADVKPSDSPRGSVSFSRKLQRVSSGTIALVGDASGSVDAVAGEGLSLAFRQSLALADAIVHGDLRAYDREHRRLHRAPLRMAQALLLMGRSPWLRDLTLRTFTCFPSAFSALLRSHVSDARQAAGLDPQDAGLYTMQAADLYTKTGSPVASNTGAASTT